ncbi:hypothetical protein CBL_10486 [Carabus blaptoides fortunei]
MVHPEKLQEIKQNFIGQFLPKSKLKPISSVNPNIEERYRTELPVQKRTITTGKRKATAISKSAPKNTVHEPMKPAQPLKLRNPMDPKVSKTQSVPQSNNNTQLLKPAVPVSKSTMSKPAASVDKTRKLSTVRPTVANQAKKEPITNNKPVTVPKYNNTSSLPLGDSFTVKQKETSKITKTVSKSNPKSILKQSPKGNEIKVDVPKEKAVFNSIVTNIEKSLGAKKKALNSPKKLIKPKTDVLGDGVKEIKRTKKFNRSSSKSAKSLKYIDKPTSPKSISNVSFREIKHNDSLIISARKLQNATGVRKSLKPEFIKLYRRPTQTRSNVATGTNQLKSCMKKDWKDSSAVGKCVDRSIPTLNFGMHKVFGKALVK